MSASESGRTCPEPDFLLDLLPRHRAAIQRIGQHRVEVRLLLLVWMPGVVRRQLAHDRQCEIEKPRAP